MDDAPSRTAARSPHLSIGEALDALKAEFPDITISKIRFFEGQGLVEPERTPSGYRKFTANDIERLRWVLRQQQEAYLPLKVLRERMAAAEATGAIPPRVAARTVDADADDVSGTASAGAAHELGSLGSLDDLALGLDDLDDLALDDDGDDDGDDAGDDAADDTDDVGGAVGGAVGEAVTAPNGSGKAAGSGPSVGERMLVEAARRRGAAGLGPDRVARGVSALDATAESMGEFRHPAARARAAKLRTTPPVQPVRHPATPAVQAPPAPPATVVAAPGQAAVAPRSAASASPAARADVPAPAAPSPAREVLGARNPMLGPAGGAPLAFHELAAASGLSLDDLRLLEEFGLITGRQMFDGRYYDEEALTVAKTVVAFRAFGVEPRHLRMYKSAADREAAFFAQVVSPTLHRRGDDARAKAAATLSELRRLGEQLREIALGQALRDVLDGRS